ncbi:chorismate-binding protein [Flagellimonas flava]|uniref:isochorismate synthase n=1 Tax=Flagellimonas flava TaxID=570519 RepID=A0A1M5J2G5_9FLAO|nr:chorismate-binding protein [Allomuricauda flava]SHG34722.1 isochorismate synthase [Allomuricauda flava]
MPFPENKDFQQLISKIKSCFEQGLPFAVYRKPGEAELTGVFQSNQVIHRTENFVGQGFVFAPYDFNDDAILIQADEVLKLACPQPLTHAPNRAKVSNDGRNAHMDMVARAVKEIQKGSLKKVVLSRKLDVKVYQEPDVIFTQLLRHYPDALCYLWFHPKVGTWCGATPETLLKVKGNQLRTMSLAATMSVREGEEPKWGSKEIEEQEMVSDYVRERLSILTDKLEVGKVQSVRAGNLWHLKSEVKATLLKNSMDQIIKALHPTPAVCGVPVLEAKDFIAKHENYKRTYYTGFLGELNLCAQDEVSLFVNLRCMTIQNGMASIFVGGGITAASNPESEWIETQNKSRTMLNILEFEYQ